MGGDLSGTGCCGPLFGVRFGGVGRKTPQRRVGKAALRRIKKRFAFTFKHAGNEILGTVQCNSQAHNIIAAQSSVHASVEEIAHCCPTTPGAVP